MKWEKYCLLGAGCYGSVYLAVPLDNSSFTTSVMAVKSVDMDSSSSLQGEAELLRELRGCQNVIQGFGTDVSTENGKTVYNLLFEYAFGGSLNDMISTYKGVMAESQVAAYTYMLLKGLASIHDKGIVHCDLKPNNIWVFPRPGLSEISLLKIANFALSKKECKGSTEGRGTPEYASPETLLYGLNEKSGDIWALGCIVVEMITGRSLWSSIRHLRVLFHQIKNGKPKIPENLSEDGKDFLKRCLEKDHDKRWTAEMLLDHPFIIKNVKLSSDETNKELVFSNKSWICSRDMFSTPLEAQSDQVYKPYQLFPEDGYMHPFGLPYGEGLRAFFKN